MLILIFFWLAHKFFNRFFQCFTSHNLCCRPSRGNQLDWFSFPCRPAGGRSKSSKMDLLDCDLCGFGSAFKRFESFSAFETAWIFTLTGSFKPLQSSKFPFFKICLNFPLNRAYMEKAKLYFCLPHPRMVGTVLTSWLWRSPLSSCSRRASPDFRCSDPSVYLGDQIEMSRWRRKKVAIFNSLKDRCNLSRTNLISRF